MKSPAPQQSTPSTPKPTLQHRPPTSSYTYDPLKPPVYETLLANGDMYIEVVTASGQPKRYLVGSQILCAASEVFSKMFGPDSPFIERARLMGKEKGLDKEKEVEKVKVREVVVTKEVEEGKDGLEEEIWSPRLVPEVRRDMGFRSMFGAPADEEVKVEPLDPENEETKKDDLGAKDGGGSEKGAVKVAHDKENSPSPPSPSEFQTHDGKPIYKLPDNPSMLHLILQILHHITDSIPRSPSFREIVEIAIIADKYKLRSSLQLWNDMWDRNFKWADVLKPGFEDWLFISWVYNYAPGFKRHSEQSIRTASIVDGELAFWNGSDGYTTFTEHLPAVVIDRLKAARSIRVNKIRDNLNSLFERYSGDPSTIGHICKRPAGCNQMECHAMQAGDLVIKMARYELNKDSFWDQSLEVIHRKLAELKPVIFPGTTPNLLDDKPVEAPKATTKSTALFGGASQASGTTFGSAPGTGLFGAQRPAASNTSTNSLFGAPRTSNTTGESLFGAPTSTAPQNTTPTTTSLFGNTAPSTTTGGLFGGGTTTTTTASNTLFGAAPATTPVASTSSLFGGPSTTATAPATTATSNLFGGATRPVPSSTALLFSNPPPAPSSSAAATVSSTTSASVLTPSPNLYIPPNKRCAFCNSITQHLRSTCRIIPHTECSWVPEFLAVVEETWKTVVGIEFESFKSKVGVGRVNSPGGTVVGKLQVPQG